MGVVFPVSTPSIVTLAPDGNEVHRIPFPAKKVSSIVFGGNDYRDAYVTTANVNGRDEEGPGAGALFRVTRAALTPSTAVVRHDSTVAGGIR